MAQGERVGWASKNFFNQNYIICGANLSLIFNYEDKASYEGSWSETAILKFFLFMKKLFWWIYRENPSRMSEANKQDSR